MLDFMNLDGMEGYCRVMVIVETQKQVLIELVDVFVGNG